MIHSVISHCTRCVRLRTSIPGPVIADLPETRVVQCHQFSHVGLDYAGPISMRENQLRKSRTYKANIAVLECQVPRRFTWNLCQICQPQLSSQLLVGLSLGNWHGVPTTVHSNCGTNFFSADRQLHQLVNSLSAQSTITSAKSYCEWKFNPPSALHFDGLWEATVRSAKRLLVRIVGAHNFTYEEFTTVLCRVEVMLNS